MGRPGDPADPWRVLVVAAKDPAPTRSSGEGRHMNTSARRKALILATIHVALVASLGVILLVDRAMRPRIWAKTVLIDPEATLRGRYVSLRIEAEAETALTDNYVLLIVRNGHLSATRAESPTGIWLRGSNPAVGGIAPTTSTMQVSPSLDFFLPRTLIDEWRGRSEDQPIWDKQVEVWAEVTLRRGPPRPIRLGVKKNGILTPLCNFVACSNVATRRWCMNRSWPATTPADAGHLPMAYDAGLPR